MAYDAQVLQAALGARPFRYFDVIDSTNDIALDWLRKGAPGGAVVLADEQKRGRGRLGRTWHAPAGSALIVSIVLDVLPDTVGRVTQLGAVAVCETLEAAGVPGVGIKWPNDVQVGGKKVCGILPEAAWSGDHLLGVVLGIGLNVRIDFRRTGLEDSATSIEPALGRPVDRVELLKALLERVDAWIPRIASADLHDSWRARLTMLGQQVIVRDVDGDIHGLAVDVDAQGALMVATGPDSDIRRVVAGDIALGE